MSMNPVKLVAPKNITELSKNLEMLTQSPNSYKLGDKCEVIDMQGAPGSGHVHLQNLKSIECMFDAIARDTTVTAGEITQFQRHLQAYIEGSKAILGAEGNSLFEKVRVFAQKAIHADPNFLESAWKHAKNHAPRRQIIGFAQYACSTKQGVIGLSAQVRWALIKIASEETVSYDSLSNDERIELLALVEKYNREGDSKGAFSSKLYSEIHLMVFTRLLDDYPTAQMTLESFTRSSWKGIRTIVAPELKAAIKKRFDKAEEELAKEIRKIAPSIPQMDLSEIARAINLLDLSASFPASERSDLRNSLTSRLQELWNVAKDKEPKDILLLKFVDESYAKAPLFPEVKKQLIYLANSSSNKLPDHFNLDALSPEGIVELCSVLDSYAEHMKYNNFSLDLLKNVRDFLCNMAKREASTRFDDMAKDLPLKQERAFKAAKVLEILQSEKWAGSLDVFRDALETALAKYTGSFPAYEKTREAVLFAIGNRALKKELAFQRKSEPPAPIPALPTVEEVAQRIIDLKKQQRLSKIAELEEKLQNQEIAGSDEEESIFFVEDETTPSYLEKLKKEEPDWEKDKQSYIQMETWVRNHPKELPSWRIGNNPNSMDMSQGIHLGKSVEEIRSIVVELFRNFVLDSQLMTEADFWNAPDSTDYVVLSNILSGADLTHLFGAKVLTSYLKDHDKLQVAEKRLVIEKGATHINATLTSIGVLKLESISNGFVAGRKIVGTANAKGYERTFQPIGYQGYNTSILRDEKGTDWVVDTGRGHFSTQTIFPDLKLAEYMQNRFKVLGGERNLTIQIPLSEIGLA